MKPRPQEFRIKSETLLEMVETLVLLIDHAPDKNSNIDRINDRITDLEFALEDRKIDKTPVLAMNNEGDVDDIEMDIKVPTLLMTLANEIKEIIANKQTDKEGKLSSTQIAKLKEFDKLAKSYIKLPIVNDPYLQMKYKALGEFVITFRSKEIQPFVKYYLVGKDQEARDKFVTDEFKEIWNNPRNMLQNK